MMTARFLLFAVASIAFTPVATQAQPTSKGQAKNAESSGSLRHAFDNFYVVRGKWTAGDEPCSLNFSDNSSQIAVNYLKGYKFKVRLFLEAEARPASATLELDDVQSARGEYSARYGFQEWSFELDRALVLRLFAAKSITVDSNGKTIALLTSGGTEALKKYRRCERDSFGDFIAGW